MISKMESDAYRTLVAPSDEGVYKEKGSKFIAYAFPVNTEEQAGELIQEMRKKHAKSRHCCFAWQIGTDDMTFRYSDDGEPNNSAGKPIYGQLQSFELTDSLVVVIRYFGGVKLGVGGLVNAYKSAARLCLENAAIVSKYRMSVYGVHFDYVNMDRVMRLIRELDLNIVSQEMDLDCRMQISVRRGRQAEAERALGELRFAEVRKLT